MVAAGLDKCVVFFRGHPGHRLEPVGKVGGPFFQSPFLHGLRHHIGCLCVNGFACFYRVHQLFESLFGKSFLHGLAVKGVLPEILRYGNKLFLFDQILSFCRGGLFRLLHNRISPSV